MSRAARPDLSIVPLEPSHAPAMAALVATRIGRLRERVPALPAAWTEEPALARLVTELAVRGTGAAAYAAGRPVGFLAATVIDGHGGRWAYAPDVGHAAEGVHAALVVEQLYGRLAQAWVREAILEHVVTALADDDATISTLARLGFGQTVVDLVRDLSPVAGPRPRGIEIRQAGPADTSAVVDLDLGLRRHLAGSPIFRRLGPPSPPELQRRALGDPGGATFLAEQGGRPLAFLRIGPSATDVATIVRDPGTASITAAFTVPERRGGGIARALLGAAISWAREAGYARTAVDHESANGEAYRFWARHFTPVAVSMTRRVAVRPAP